MSRSPNAPCIAPSFSPSCSRPPPATSGLVAAQDSDGTAVGNAWTDVEERFATSVRRLDECVGDLRKTLRDLGIADKTLIVFTSDNGPHLEDYLSTAQSHDGLSYTPQSFDSYGPFEGTKRDPWEGGIRMPTLAVWPGTITPEQTDSTPSQMHDWMPTFCELAG